MTSADAERNLADFLARNRDALLRHARFVVQTAPRLDPEDVLQAGSLDFFRYLRKRQLAVEEAGLLALAKQCIETARNDQLKWLHAQKRRAELRAQAPPSSGVAPAAGAAGPATLAAREEQAAVRRQLLHQALQTLPPIDRHVLELRIEDDAYYTFARIGTVLGSSEDAVRMRYRRAIETIKPLLRELLGDDSMFGAG